MPTQSSASREKILASLRANRPPFQDAPPRPEHYIPVARIEQIDTDAMIERFKAEVERLTGKVHVTNGDQLQREQEAVDAVFEILGDDKAILAWENLPIPALKIAFAQRGVEMVIPHVRGDQRASELKRADPVRVGITGVDAAFAATGTLALKVLSGQGRIPSLLSSVHIALLDRTKLYPRMEEWLQAEGRTAVAESSSIVFITGPSRTADIEMQVILGVHGPGKLHYIIY